MINLLISVSIDFPGVITVINWKLECIMSKVVHYIGQKLGNPLASLFNTNSEMRLYTYLKEYLFSSNSTTVQYAMSHLMLFFVSIGMPVVNDVLSCHSIPR